MELLKKIKNLALLSCVSAGAFLQAGCQKFQESTGIRRQGADAFKVHPVKSLEVPPDFDRLPSDEKIPSVNTKSDSLGVSKPVSVKKTTPQPAGSRAQEAELKLLERIKRAK